MKRSFLIVLLLFFNFSLSANDDIKHHSLSYSAGGMGGMITLEYDYRFINTQNLSFALTIGAGGAFAAFAFPIGINFTLGEKHQFLCGFHYVPTILDNLWADIPSDEEYSLHHNLSPRIGYRERVKFWKLNWLLQIYFSPIYQFEYTRILPWGGLGLGIEF